MKDSMAVGDVVLLDNGERLTILGVRFVPDPGITLGVYPVTAWQDTRPKWYLEATIDTAITWLPEYGAWRVSGAHLQPIFHEAALTYASGREVL